MDIEYAKKSILRVFQNTNQNQVYVEFYGGEPLLLYDQIKELINFSERISSLYKKKVGFGLITNSTLFTKEIIEFCKHKNIVVEVSIDGDKDSHDRHRVDTESKGSFNSVIKSFNLMKEQKFEPYSAQILVTPKTVNKFYHNMKFLQQIGFKKVVKDLNPHVNWNPESLEEYHNQFRKLCSYVQQNPEIECFPFIKRGLEFFNEKNITIDKNRFCGAACSFITIAPNKAVYPCARFYFMDSYKLADNIDSYVSLNSENKKVFNKFHQDKCVKMQKCNKCELVSFCQNYSGVYCLAKNHLINNDLLKPFALKCEITRIEHECIKELNKNINGKNTSKY